MSESAEPEVARQIASQVERVNTFGNPKAALDTLDTLRAGADRHYRPDAPLIQRILTTKVWAGVTLGRLDDAEGWLTEARRLQASFTEAFGETPDQRDARLHAMGAESYLVSERDDLETALALMSAQAEQRENDPDRFEHANALRGLATFQYFSGQQVQSVATLERAISMMDRVVDPLHPAQIDRYIGGLSTLAALQTISGRADDGFANQEKAARLANAYLNDYPQTQSVVLHNFGDALSRRGRHAEAVTVLQRSLQASQRSLGRSHPETAATLGRIATAQMQIGRYADAERLFLSAYEISSPSDAHSRISVNMISDAAIAAHRDGRLDEALRHHAVALADMDKLSTERLPEFALVHSYYADALYEAGRMDEALTQAEIGLRMARAHLPEDAPELRTALAQHALVLSRTDPAAARLTIRSMADDLEAAILQQGYSDQGWSRAVEALANPLSLALQGAVQTDDADMAFRLIQLSTLTDMSEWEQRHRLRESEGDAATAELHDLLRLARESRNQLETDRNRALGEGAADEAERLSDDIAKARRRIADLSETLVTQAGRVAAPFNLLDQRSAKNALKDGEALLIVSTGGRPVSMLLTKEGSSITGLPAFGSGLSRDTDSLRTRIANFDPVLPGDADIVRLSWMLDGAELDGVETLHVVSTGPYGRYPVHLLPDPIDPDRWLGERIALSHLPSVGSLSFRRRVEWGERPALLAIGDPDFGTGTASSEDALAFGSPRQLTGLTPLPGTRAEIDAVRSALNPRAETTLMGRDANEGAVKDLPLEDYTIMLFATHGLLAGELDGLTEPALALAAPLNTEARHDGLLTASEITALSMNPALVILSACNTAAPDGQSNRPLSGLPQAFFSAGADTVMVSHWPVRDDAAQFLSTRTLQAIADGSTPAMALRDAMAALRESDLPNADHPGLWAPFVIVGG